MDYLSGIWMEKHPFPPETKAAVRRLAKSHAEYMNMFSTVRFPFTDISWVSLLDLSGQQLLRLMEAGCIDTLMQHVFTLLVVPSRWLALG